MKPSLLLIIPAVVWVASLSPSPGEARAAADPRDDPRKKSVAPAARPTARPVARPAVPARPTPPSRVQTPAARNPITGSNVTKRPNPAPANVNRPAVTKPAAKPAVPVNRPNPAPGVAKRPAPKAVTPPANKTIPKAIPKAVPKAVPNPPVNVANRPAPKPAPRPTPKLPPGKVVNRPNPNPPVNIANRPAARPQPLPAAKRPAFVPGKVTYPGKVTKPAPRPNPTPKAVHPASYVNRPRPKSLNQVIAGNNVNSNNRVTNVNNNTSNRVNNIGNNVGNTNTRVTNVSNNTYVNNNWGNQWTNNRTSVWNANRVVNNRPVVINTNFTRSVNYAYRPTSWGARPWWSSSTYHSWHHGSWNYGWNRGWQSYHYQRPYYRPPVGYPPGYYYRDNDPDVGEAVAWGIAAWSLGRLAFDTGYNSYRNPYPAPPVQTRTTVINYTQPMSVVASQEVPPAEDVAATAEEMSTAATERARGEFGAGDYLASLKSTDEAISYAPGDSTLHEFRALCLFALGRYGDAAGVLNPVLASGPGWDWATMADFYPDSEIYTGQLRKLETYVESSPESADSHFLLGYHYMVAGFIDEAYAMFDTVTRLQPADTVSAQLRSLAENSSSSPEGEEPESLTGTPEAPEALPSDVVVELIEPVDIEGGWKSASADGKAISLVLDQTGTFTWNYEGASDGKVLAGDWSVDEKGQLVLASEDVQMIADVALDGDTMVFVLAGSPVGDPGLTFQRQ